MKIKESKRNKNTERLERIRKNRQIVENTFLVFYNSVVFNNRMSYKNFFREELVSYWELYLDELNLALNNLALHEKNFLENCFKRGMTYKDMFFSKASYYRCLGQYSKKFLSLFDFELFHITLANMYNSSLEPKFRQI